MLTGSDGELWTIFVEDRNVGQPAFCEFRCEHVASGNETWSAGSQNAESDMCCNCRYADVPH